MTPLSVSAQIAKLRKERMALEKQEQALINKTYREAIAQIKVIMKGSGLGLDDLVHYLEGTPAKSDLGDTAASISAKLGKGARSSHGLTLKGARTSKTAPSAKLAKLAKLTKASKSDKRKKPSSRAGIKVPIKYQHPTESHLNWTGRGKTPTWVSALKTAGELDKALVQKV
jgi:DNA-binding protein H-NS